MFTIDQYQSIMLRVMAEFGFSTEDLEYNRAGRLSPSQASTFVLQRQNLLGRAVYLSLIYLILLLIINTALQDIMAGMIFTVAALSLLSIVGVYVWRQYGRLERALDGPQQVVAFTGPMTFRNEFTGGRFPRKYLKIHNQAFPVSYEQYLALKVAPYGTVYLLAGTGAVLSLEIYMKSQDIPQGVAELLGAAAV